MENSNPVNSSPLIIASMHRSGSSLVASLIQSAGLHIGQQLMPPTEANVKGYFENLDFCSFHQSVLRSQGINDCGWTLQEKIDVDDRFINLAHDLVQRNTVSNLWGWKDPRTTLFLDFWAEFLPRANFLLIYRSPWDVIDSLYRRRSDSIFKQEPELAVKAWLHYNRKILNLFDRLPDRCFLIDIDTLINSQADWIEALNQKFQINLAAPESTIYEARLLHKQSANSCRSSLIAHYFPESIMMLRELDARSWQPEREPSWQDLIKPSPYRIWAFQDWVDLRRLESEYQTVQARLKEGQTQQQQTDQVLAQEQSQIVQLEVSIRNLQAESEQAKSQLDQTESELEQSKSQLAKTLDLLEHSQSQLNQTEQVLVQYQAQTTQLEQLINQLQIDRSQQQAQLDQTKSQLDETNQMLELSQAQLGETEKVLEQALEQSRSKLDLNRTELAQTKSQFHQTQAELEQTKSQIDQLKQLIYSGIDQKQMHYELLVSEAWDAYKNGDLYTMQQCLQRSLKYSQVDRVQTMIAWIEKFGIYALEQGYALDILMLTDSYEWRYLVKPPAVKQIAKIA